MQCPPHGSNSAGPGARSAEEMPVRTVERRVSRSPANAQQRFLNRRAADVVKSCREAAGLDRAALAERLDVPEQIVALWEDPHYEGVDLAILRRVARAAGGELEIRFRPAAASVRAAG